jgi:hypothetical protein
MRYSFKIPSAITNINIAKFPIKCRKFRVTKISYQNLQQDIKSFFIDINGLASNYYFDGFNIVPYVFYSPIVLGANIYSNFNCDSYDMTFDNDYRFTYFQVNIMDNSGAYCPYITIDNPLVIEIEFLL